MNGISNANKGGAKAIMSRLLAVEEEERKRIARGLHDATAQNLVGALMCMDRLKEMHRSRIDGADRRDDDIDAMMAEARTLIDRSLAEIRTLSYMLHPPLLAEFGFAAALMQLTIGFERRSGISVSLRLPETLQPLPRAIESTLFRLVQEALTNVCLHSGSATAEVELRRSPKRLILQIRDRGNGLPTTPAGDAPRLGIGISSMRARLRDLGGDLKIRSQRTGTVATATVPLTTSLRQAAAD